MYRQLSQRSHQLGQFEQLESRETQKAGELLINIHATGAALKVLVTVLEKINQDMIAIASEKGRFSEIAVKKFVVSYSSIRFVD